MNNLLILNGMIFKVKSIYYETCRDGVIYRIDTPVQITQEMLNDPWASYHLELEKGGGVTTVNGDSIDKLKTISGNFDPNFIQMLYARR